MAGIDIKVIVFCFFFVFVKASTMNLNINNTWIEDHGWEVTCNWTLFSNDSLQSVRLYLNGHQFFVHRPEVHGPSFRAYIPRPPEDAMELNCTETTKTSGICVLKIELFQPQREDYFITCEISGERPKFYRREETILINGLVSPSKAVIVGTQDTDTGRVTVNCTSSGMPAPTLTWTVGKQKVPHDFTGSIWNATSKLWTAWSLLSYTPQNSDDAAVCSPEIDKGEHWLKGETAVYSSSDIYRPHIQNLLVLALSMVLY